MSTWLWIAIAVSALLAAAGTALAFGFYRLASTWKNREAASQERPNYLRPLDGRHAAKPSPNVQFEDAEEATQVRQTVGAGSEAGVEDFVGLLPEEQAVGTADRALQLELFEANRVAPDVPVLDDTSIRHAIRLPEVLRPIRPQTRRVSLARSLARVFVVLAPTGGKYDVCVKTLRFLDLQSYDVAILIEPEGRRVPSSVRREFPEALVVRPQHVGEPPLLSAVRATSGWHGACDSDLFVCIGEGIYGRPDLVSRLAGFALRPGNASRCSMVRQGKVPTNLHDIDKREENKTVEFAAIIASCAPRSRLVVDAILGASDFVRARPELGVLVCARTLAMEDDPKPYDECKIPCVVAGQRLLSPSQRREAQEHVEAQLKASVEAVLNTVSAADERDRCAKLDAQEDARRKDWLARLPENVRKQMDQGQSSDLDAALAAGVEAGRSSRPLLPGDAHALHIMQRSLRACLTPKAQKMMREGGVRLWVSLTSSPARLGFVESVLQSPDLRHVSGVFLNLPDTYRPTGEEYTVSARLYGSCSKLWINRCGADIGPATKIIPTIRALQVSGRPLHDIVVSIDDDQFYARNVLTSLVNYAAELGPRCAVGGVGNRAEVWRLDAFPGEKGRNEGKRDKRIKDVEGCYPVDLVEGFGAIAYRLGHIQPDVLTQQAQLSKNTLISDDYVISWHLAERGVGRATVYRDPIWQHVCAYGREEDALHVQCVNETKYQHAEQALLKQRKTIRDLAEGKVAAKGQARVSDIVRSTTEMLAGAMGVELPARKLVAGSLPSGVAKQMDEVSAEIRTLRLQKKQLGGLGSMAKRRSAAMRAARAQLVARLELMGGDVIRRVDEWA